MKEKRKKSPLGTEPSGRSGLGLEHAPHDVAVKPAILSVEVATSTRELDTPGKALRLPIRWLKPADCIG